MSRRLPVPPPGQRNEYYSKKLSDLTNVLSDTNDNITEIDRELTKSRNRKKYHDIEYDHRFDDDYYHNQVSKTRKNSNKRSQLKPSLSDTEDEFPSSNHRHKNRRNVVFRDDLNESLHELHQQVRDLSFEHDKLADHFNSEITRNKYDKRYQNDLSDSPTSSLEKRMEKRFSNVLEKMKHEKSEDTLREEIKNTLDEFRKVSKDDITHLKLTMMEADKQKVENELLSTKQRLVEIEDSKNSLSSQVQQLRDQLNRFEVHNMQPQSVNRHLPNCILNTASDVGIKTNCKCCIEKEIESLKAEINKSKFSDSTTEVVRAIGKYEKQKDILSEHNQSLRKLLEEKENHENQLTLEVKLLNDKNDKLDKQNSKLQMDLEMALGKLQEITQEVEKYANALRNAEEQLNISEFKRNELKQDAQETVKLWKAKVKKLEKSIDKYKTESIQLGEENEQIKSKHSNYVTQFENKIKDFTNLKELNENLEERLNVREVEINHFKVLFEELRNQNEALKSEFNESKVNNKQYENRLFNLQSEKADLERQLLIESEKYRDILERYSQFESELALSNEERKNLEIYASKLEHECQKLKSCLNNLKEVGTAAKNDLNCVSLQAIQNKENYEDKMCKMNKELQKAQFQLQKVKLECEDSIRMSQVQIAEERSKVELFKKRENEYLKEIEELKETRRKIEDDLLDLQTNHEKLSRNDNEKSKQLLDYEEKFNKMISEMSEQKTFFYNKESEYWQILNTLNVDIDLISGLLSTNANELYKPINIIDETEKDKARSFYLLIKSKINWIGKEVEVFLKKSCKSQQTINFLEHELDKLKKKSISTMKTTDLFIQKLESQTNDLEAEKSLAYKNMELLHNYLMSLSESLKTHSLKEIERTHHLIAVDNVLSICNNDRLYENGRDDIYDRFKQFTNTINDIKYQLQATKLDNNNYDSCIKEQPTSLKNINNTKTFTSNNDNKKVARLCKQKLNNKN